MLLMNSCDNYMEGTVVAECIWGINKNTIINIVIPTESDDHYYDSMEIIYTTIPHDCINRLDVKSYEGPQFMIGDIHVYFQYYANYPTMFSYYYDKKWLFDKNIFHKIIDINSDDDYYEDDEHVELTKQLCDTYDIKLVKNF